jgi:hypothetical protein
MLTDLVKKFLRKFLKANMISHVPVAFWFHSRYDAKIRYFAEWFIRAPEMSKSQKFEM